MKELPHRVDLRDRKFNKKKSNWAVLITCITFFISLILGFFSDLLSKNLNIYLAFLVLVAIIFIGIMFDVVGIAIASADEKPLNSMASRKIRGAKQALVLLKNAEKTTNVCNDVVGDIAGIIAGGTSVTIGTYVLKILVENIKSAENPLIEVFVFSLISAFAAAITVGGKAIGKKFALEKANDIVFNVGRIMSIIKRD